MDDPGQVFEAKPRRASKPFVAVAVLAENRKSAAALVRKVRSTSVARVVLFGRIVPSQILTKSVMKEIHESPTIVALVAIDAKSPQPAIEAISLLRSSTKGLCVLGCGPMNPKIIVAAIRAGAHEFVDDATSPSDLTETLRRRLCKDDDPGTSGFFRPDSGPSGGSPPPAVLVRVPRPRGPKTLPSRHAIPEMCD